MQSSFGGLYDEAELAKQLPAASAASRPADSRGGFAGRSFGVGNGGVSGGVPADANAPIAGTGVVVREVLERDKVAQNVRNVGAKSFFRRGERWVDSTLTEEQEKKAKKIKRFSDEYFELVDRHGKQVAKYLAFDEPVTLVIDGQVYEFIDDPR